MTHETRGILGNRVNLIVFVNFVGLGRRNVVRAGGEILWMGSLVFSLGCLDILGSRSTSLVYLGCWRIRCRRVKGRSDQQRENEKRRRYQEPQNLIIGPLLYRVHSTMLPDYPKFRLLGNCEI